MYNGYPYAVVVVYYENPSLEISVKQIEKLSNMIRECNNYLIHRHTNIYLVANITSNAKKSHHVLESNDHCISKVICANGYEAAEIIGIALEEQSKEIKNIAQTSLAKFKLLPIYVIAIQYEEAVNKVNIDIFPDSYKKHLQLHTFTVNHASPHVLAEEGDFRQLQSYLRNLFEAKLTNAIADIISKKEKVSVETQSCFQLC